MSESSPVVGERELKPCPFCGGEAAPATVRYSDETVREQHWGQDTFHYVSCIRCGSNNKGLVGSLTTSKAAETWNRRAAANPEPAEADKRDLDTKRLDWLDAHATTTLFGNRFFVACDCFVGDPATRTLRTIIDNAIDAHLSTPIPQPKKDWPLVKKITDENRLAWLARQGCSVRRRGDGRRNAVVWFAIADFDDHLTDLERLRIAIDKKIREEGSAP